MITYQLSHGHRAFRLSSQVFSGKSPGAFSFCQSQSPPMMSGGKKKRPAQPMTNTLITAVVSINTDGGPPVTEAKYL